MKKFTYPVIAFRQQEKAPIQVTFVAYAGQVLEWAGIPRKSDELLTGYQRFRDDDRINKSIVPFFQDPENCSPTAIILALRSDSGLGRCSLAISDVPLGQVVETELTIELDDEALKDNRVFESACKYIAARLARDKDFVEDVEAEGEEENGDEDLDEAEDEMESEEGGEISVHLGSETLARMNQLLEDKNNWGNENFREAIGDYVKPALLIDGQHRIAAGARFGDKGLPFMICGLYDAPWEEQVFQFTVVNLKPKRIPPSLITSIAALSLSKSEQRSLQKRLNQAGVKMTEVEIMSLVAYDEHSPFCNLVDMGVGEKARRNDLLGYGAMKRIAKVWFSARRNSLVQIAKRLWGTNNLSHARNEWRTSRVWFEFYCVFWETVRAHYPDALWKKGEDNRLFVGAHLWALQQALLMEADGQMPSQWKTEEDAPFEKKLEQLRAAMMEVIQTSLVYLPSEMWMIPWAKASQDTNQGREELVTLFRKLIDQGKQEGRVWKNWKKDDWFTAS